MSVDGCVNGVEVESCCNVLGVPDSFVAFMSRLNRAAKFSVIGVGMPEGGQGSCTEWILDFGGTEFSGGISVRVFVGGVFGRNFGCIVRMEA